MLFVSISPRLGRMAAARLFVLMILPVLALSSAASASQSARQKWWQDDDIRAELKLTPQQSAELEQIFQAMVPRFKSAKQDLEREENELSRLIEISKDEVVVAQQIDRVEAARSELGKARTLMMFRMHRVLSADQRAKLKGIYERSRRDHQRDRRKDRY